MRKDRIIPDKFADASASRQTLATARAMLVSYRRRRTRIGILGAILLWAVTAAGADDDLARFAVVELSGAALPRLVGTDIAHLACFACTADGCRPIPFQVDQRTADGRWALPNGRNPVLDESPTLFDRDDLLLWMARDAGTRTGSREQLPAHHIAVPVAVIDQRDGSRGWVYMVATNETAPRATAHYVAYDEAADLLRGERVALGFAAGTPDRLSPVAADGSLGPDLLDRFKVRAAASALFGLVRFRRDESDLSVHESAWHAGPIRVIRYQGQRVRLGFGVRSPLFAFHSFFTPGYAELPVGLWLNFRPTYFFTDVRVDVRLDFRDLGGWRLQVAGAPAAGIDGAERPRRFTAIGHGHDWFALHGPGLTLAQAIDFSESLLAARRRTMVVQDSRRRAPEEFDGERPGVGYRIDGWEGVAAGAHGLKAVAYALSPGTEVAAFMATRYAFVASVEE